MTTPYINYEETGHNNFCSPTEFQKNKHVEEKKHQTEIICVAKQHVHFYRKGHNECHCEVRPQNEIKLN